jgi:UDP-glucose 4-epimerase
VGRHLVTGGAGFIGSHVVDRLVAEDREVVVYDNLSNTSLRWIQRHLDAGDATFVEGDILDVDTLAPAMAGAEVVVHLASSVDMRRGIEDRVLDLEQGPVGTQRVLEAMRRNGVRELIFSSSSTVFGDPPYVPTDETVGPMLPISLYGAGKLAAEAMISAYSHLDDLRATMFRFGNVVGGRMNHGVIFDFISKLRETPDRLEVLGDGRQAKTYFLVEDCVDGMLSVHPRLGDGCEVVNLANEGTVAVDRIAEIVIEEMGCGGAEVVHTGGSRGWPGDVPVVHFDVSKAHGLGWHPTADGEAAVRECTRRLLAETAA